MLTKIMGTGTVLTMSATTQSVTVTTFTSNSSYEGVLPALKVRIATNSQPAFINFGTSTVASSSTGILIPANHAEHFKLDSTNVVTVLQAGTAGTISIVAVA